MNVDYLIALAILLIVYLRLKVIGKRAKQGAYEWWYIPWLGMLYAAGLFVFYRDFEVSRWANYEFALAEYQTEAVFSLIGLLVWTFLSFILKNGSLPDRLLSLYRFVFAGKRPDKDKVYPFPYFEDESGVVRSHVGLFFYRWTVKTVSLCLALIYALFFLAVHFFHIPFYLISAFGLLGLIPLLDYYKYLCCEVENDKAPLKQIHKADVSDLEELWKQYIGLFDNYSIAWKKYDNHSAKDYLNDNNEETEDLIRSMTEDHSDGVIENCDLTDAFDRIKPLFEWVEKNGKLILVALDIPRQFFSHQVASQTEQIATRLTQILRMNFLAYGENTPRASLNNSILVAPLSLLSRQPLDPEWVRKIGLITVVNLFDKGISNLHDCRKFCFLLQAGNKDYQILFINPYRRGAEPSLRNTWVTNNPISEKNLRQFAKGDQFYIGYNYEDYKDRFLKILKAIPNEPLYSGSELALIALSSKFNKKTKSVTPVNYLDLSYTNVIEGKEEVGKFRSQLDSSLLSVSANDINQNMVNHMLPVEQVEQEEVFSIIFDQENNSPAAYTKWMHLGSEKNFSIVISRPYLFRDFFNDNIERFIASPFAALQPHLCKSRVTLANILLDMLRKTRVEERNLRSLLRYYYDEDEVKSVSGTVRQLLDIYFSASLADRLQTSFEVSFEAGSYSHNTFYSIDVKDNVGLSYLDAVSVEDENGIVFFEIIKDLLFQNFEKGQIHSFSGKPYSVLEYDEVNKTLKVKAVNNTDVDTVFYKPVLDVSLSGTRTPIKEIEGVSYKWTSVDNQPLSLSFEGFETHLDVRTDEWYSFYRYGIAGGNFVSVDSKSPARSYKNGKVLKVSFRYHPKYKDRIDDIRKGLQILMYEAIQSVFPQHAQYLVISSLGEGDKDLPWIFNKFTADDSFVDGELSYYFIEDAHIDLGLIGALSNRENFGDKYLFRYIFDYLMWLKEENRPETGSYDSYILKENQDKFTFLKYGRDYLPSYFDINLLISFIADFFCDKDQRLRQG